MVQFGRQSGTQPWVVLRWWEGDRPKFRVKTVRQQCICR